MNPNPHSYSSEREFQVVAALAEVDWVDNVAHQLSWYRFIGRILGKALYDRILVKVTFSGFFLAKVVGQEGCSQGSADLFDWLKPYGPPSHPTNLVNLLGHRTNRTLSWGHRGL